MTVQLLRRLFTVEEYHRMADAGILTEDDRVELIRGEILQPSPQGYQKVRHVRRGQALAPQAFPDWALAVDDILG